MQEIKTGGPPSLLHEGEEQAERVYIIQSIIVSTRGPTIARFMAEQPSIATATTAGTSSVDPKRARFLDQARAPWLLRSKL
jgi:hypothetical protein